MTLAELTPWLYSRVSGGVRWGLDRTEKLLAGVDDPHRRFHSLLIGGTNGKGSVAALCDAALRARGDRRIGLYTSPHLVSFTERVRIDGRPVDAELLAEAAMRLRPLIEESGATFFEATTAMAFLVLAEANVDCVVAEVGLGGRLDATNVLTPLVTAVTNVAIDHTEYLGDTLELIAVEKSGIFKSGVPAVSGSPDVEIDRLLRTRAEEVGARFIRLDDVAAVSEPMIAPDGTRFHYRSAFWGTGTIQTSLIGVHQARNAAIAAEMLALLPPELRPTWAQVQSGFASVRWPGRLDVRKIRGTTWIFDVAHNEAGAESLAETLASLPAPRPRVVLTAILGDKDWKRMLPALFRGADRVILTTPRSAPPERIWDPHRVALWCSEHLGTNPQVMPELHGALNRAETLAPHGTIVVTGSVHTVGDAMDLLGIASIE